VRQLRRLVREGGFDLVHVNGSSDHRLVILATAGMGKKKPRIVFTKHNDIAISRFGAALRARVGTDHVIGVCDFVRDNLDASAYGRCGLSTIANGVDVQHFQPAAAHDRPALLRRWIDRPLPADALVIGSNAGTDNYKGWIDMVAAVARLPAVQRNRVQILLAGAMPGAEAMRRVAAFGMRDQVSFVGQLDDVRPFISALDLGFVLSYRIETISFACREMMAMARPVMVSRHGGLPENIDEGVDGWVVRERDISAIAARVGEVLAQPAQLRDMGQAARRKSLRRFGLDRFVAQTDMVYHDVTGHAYPERSGYRVAF
jgi:glycosyltransferase involved in cell wall biosynthesis